jgi:methionine-rich copper-binding protein CopC
MSRPTRLVAAVAGAVLAVLGPAAPAAARDDAPVSVPADGATLAAPPAQVTLSFTRQPVAAESHLLVVGPDGRTVSRSARPDVSGRLLTQQVTTDGAGVFTITYRVVLADGGQEEGVRRFTVGSGGDAAVGAHDQHEPGAGGEAHAHSVDPVSATLLVIDGAVALTVMVLLMTRRRRSEPMAWRLPATERNSDDHTA